MKRPTQWIQVSIENISASGNRTPDRQIRRQALKPPSYSNPNGATCDCSVCTHTKFYRPGTWQLFTQKFSHIKKMGG